jgi:homoserine O-acetyltransferase
VEDAWLPAYRRHDPRGLIAMLDVWLANDVAAAADTSLATALGRIQAATAVVAGRHDLYFPPADCAHEAALIPGATFHVLESDLGHRAGNPRQAPAEQAQLRAVVDELLSR